MVTGRVQVVKWRQGESMWRKRGGGENLKGVAWCQEVEQRWRDKKSARAAREELEACGTDVMKKRAD